MRRAGVVAVALILAVGTRGPARADDIGGQLDAARAAFAKGDSLRTLESAQAAVGALTAKLAEQFTRVLPPPPAGWEAGAASSQPLDEVGGGLTISRGYQKGEAALSVALILDNPAVATAQAMFQPGGIPAGEAGWSHVRIGADDALLRFDPANRDGEILLVLQGRALLQIEGSEIDSQAILTDTAKGWGIGALKKLLGS